jgi:ABC-type oligopeptide transport system substrate-binding subunit
MKRLSLIVLAVLMLVALPMALGQNDDTLVVRGFGNIDNFNPALTSDGASY